MSAVAILTLGRIRLSGGPLQLLLLLTGLEGSLQRWRRQRIQQGT